MQIIDYVEPPTALTSPDSAPSIQPGAEPGTNGPNPFSTGTQTDNNSGHFAPSPFGNSSSTTLGTDALMKKINEETKTGS